jgi:hypothetical protein
MHARLPTWPGRRRVAYTRTHTLAPCKMTTLMRLGLFAVPSPARYQLRALHTGVFWHRTNAFSSLSHNHRPSFPTRPLQLVLIPSRTISFGSIFSSKPSPTPSPHAVAHVARIEADANARPHDVEKQLGLFQALSETNIQPGYELIINRWERMTEFVRCPFWTCLDGLADLWTCRTQLHLSFIRTRLSSIISRLFSKQARKHRSTPQCAGASLSLLLIRSLLRHPRHSKPNRLNFHPRQHKKQCPPYRPRPPFLVVSKSRPQSLQAQPSKSRLHLFLD